MGNKNEQTPNQTSNYMMDYKGVDLYYSLKSDENIF
jgi:hypothetical protein